MPYTIILSKDAERQFDDLPWVVRNRLERRLDQLARAPRGGDVVRLTDPGAPGLHRAKAGRAYRIVFTIDDAREELLIVWVGYRRDAY
ncbi:MAG: type II toxin-antitoxin system RelE/ParE family toxin [Armatimonadetes bacterium]|nr:type II toxin-antitoxin system RelE/ParE family toxin [Armatimonadota bacterium]